MRVVVGSLVIVFTVSCQQTPRGEPGNQHPEASRIAQDLRLLTGRAALIFKGVVSGIEYRTDRRFGLPYTYVTFRQVQPIKDLSGKFGPSKRSRLRVRLFGGLREDGTMTVMTRIPQFSLGAVYLVFYTGGDWDTSPVVGGERGVFQIVKSRTLGHEMLLDYHDNVVVGIEGLKIHTLPLAGWSRTHGAVSAPRQQDSVATEQTDKVKVGAESIYSEENVKRMMEGGEAAKPEREDVAGDRGESRARILRALPTAPMSLKLFEERIRAIDKSYAHEFREFYSEVRLDGSPVQRERKPVGLKQK
jgi:hypothetical protein